MKSLSDWFILGLAHGKSATELCSHILGFRSKESPNPANQPRIPEQQSHRDREQRDSESDMLTQHGFNFFAQAWVRNWSRIVGFRENVRQAIVNGLLPPHRKKCSKQVHLA